MNDDQSLPMTEQDREDLASIGLDVEPPKYSLLEVWESVLSNIEAVAAQKMQPVVAIKVCGAWPQLRISDMHAYHQQYHSILLRIRHVLTEAIKANPEAKSFVGDEDLEHNFGIYKDILVGWNLVFDDLEEGWDSRNASAHVDLAALYDARGFVFTENGLVGHLNALGFQMSNEDFLAELTKAKEER